MCYSLVAVVTKGVSMCDSYQLASYKAELNTDIDSYWLLLYIANHSRWKSFAVAKLDCNSLENIRGWMAVLYGQSLLHRLFHWKSFVVTNWSMKTTKLSTSNNLQYSHSISCMDSYIYSFQNRKIVKYRIAIIDIDVAIAS